MSPDHLANRVSLYRGRTCTTFTGNGIEVNIGELEPFETEPAEDVILLRDYVLDKKVIDLEENEVEVVYDIRLVLRNKKLYVTDVDTGKAARLRRMRVRIPCKYSLFRGGSQC